MDKELFNIEAEFLLSAALFALSSLPKVELLHPRFRNTYEIATRIGLVLAERRANKRDEASL